MLVGGLAVAVGTLVGPVPALAAVPAVLLGPRIRRLRRERHRQRIAEAALPDTVDLLVLLLHAGSTPTQAAREIVDLAPDPVVPAVREVVHRLDRGHGLADALDALPDLVGPAARPLADAIASAERYGLPLAPVLTRLADDARAARRRQAEAHARTLSVRLSFPLVCCTLPAFVLLAVVPALVGALSSLGGLGP